MAPAANDTLDGGTGDDTLSGGLGNDTYYARGNEKIEDEGGDGHGHRLYLRHLYARWTSSRTRNLDERVPGMRA